MPRVGFQSLAVLAEERCLPQAKLRRSQLRHSTVQLENYQMQHSPRLEHLSGLPQHQARAWDYAVGVARSVWESRSPCATPIR